MASAVEVLQSLQERISQTNERGLLDVETQKLYFTQSRGLLYVAYYGSSYDETYSDFLQTICIPEIAAQLGALTIQGPDEGANGTRNWDFTGLIDSGTNFPCLNTFFVEPTEPDHHNQTVIGADYEEEGQIGHLLTKMPALQSLTVPSAPEAGFFERAEHPLAILRVESGYDHQNFVANFSRSDCFPHLRMLDFGDYSQRYMVNYVQQCTPFADYEALFRSQAFRNITGRGFILRNSVLSAVQLAELRRMQSSVPFYVTHSYGEYIR